MISSRHNLTSEALVIRLSTVADEPLLKSLAQLDSADLPDAPLLVAELGAQPVAALAMANGEAIADPFLPTADVVALLRLRARQLKSRASRGSHGLTRWALASREPISHPRDRLHRLLKGADVSVQRLDGGHQPVEHRG